MRSQNEIVPTSYELMTPQERVAAMDQAVDAYLDRTERENTKKAYADDWHAWTRYCSGIGIQPETVTKGTLSGFVIHLVQQGRAKHTIRRRITGVRVAMNKAGTPIPHEVVEAATKTLNREFERLAAAGVTRGYGKAKAFTIEELRAMSNACPDTVAGLRDRALLVIGFAIGGRCGELAGLHVHDLEEAPEGLDVHVRVSKTEPRDVAVPYGQYLYTCPVRTWKAWLAAAGISEGRAFRSISRHGHLGESLSADGVGDIVVRAALRAGLGKRRAHGLRSGMATEARRAGHDAIAIAPQGGWTPHSREMLGYMQRSDRWTDNPLRGIGL